MPDQETIARIQAAQAELDRRREAEARIKVQSEALKESITAWKLKCSEQGVDPANLDELIQTKEAELEDKLQRLEISLNG